MSKAPIGGNASTNKNPELGKDEPDPEKKDQGPDTKETDSENLEYEVQRAALELRNSELLAEIRINAGEQLNKLEDLGMALVAKFADKLAPLNDAKSFTNGGMKSEIDQAGKELVTAQGAFSKAELTLKEARERVDDLDRRQRSAQRMEKATNIDSDIARVEAEKAAELGILEKKSILVKSQLAAAEDAAKVDFEKELDALKAKYNIKT